MYSLLRPWLFKLDPETAHAVTLKSLDLLYKAGALKGNLIEAPVELMGLRFPNRVGLAAGLDKNGDHVDALGALGFGFVEVGTVTPKPQAGNDKPRLFRLPEREAIINRMGFNNFGVDHLVEQIKASRYKSDALGIVGINIGKNLTTSVENAVDDYLTCLRKVHAHADYVTVNLSSPNTPGLRNLQFGDVLNNLLAALKEESHRLDAEREKPLPLIVKIAPDLSDDEIGLIAKSLESNHIDAVIATNTTLDRQRVAGVPHANEAGGLSGLPVEDASNHVIRQLRTYLPQLPIIGVGGILDGEGALAKREAGADLVQLYSGLIYQGPALIKECVRVLA